MDSSGQKRMAARDTRSSARRRREWRLRAQWRHEQQTVAMALAVATHHSAQRGQWRDLNEAPRGQKTASAEAAHSAPRRPPTRAARGPELFQLFEEEPGGGRPAPLSEVAGWQERVERHTTEHTADICLFVQILDVLVPQTGAQLVKFLRFLDAQSPVEQVIDVPKISEDSIQQRFVDRDSRIPQMAEQLVEVPTVLTPSLLAEQIVDIPVPHGRGSSSDETRFAAHCGAAR